MNLAEIIQSHPAEHPAVISGGTITTYGELRDRVARLRGGLRAHGVQGGERVVLIAANNMTFVESYLAIVGMGAVAVPLNPSSPAPEVAAEIGATSAVAVIVDSSAARLWPGVDPATTPCVRLVVGPTGTEPGGRDVAVVAYDDLFTADPLDVVGVDPHSDAVLIFTSGTAGAPQAARLSHANLRANLQQMHDAPGDVSSDDVFYGVIPLCHVYGLNGVLGAVLHEGATLVLAQRFDPSTAIDSIRDRRVTVVVGVPPMWQQFAALPDVDHDAFASVRIATSGAARLPVETMIQIRDRFGIEIAEGYGLTEASPVVTNAVGQPWRPGSVGRSLVGVEIRLVDTDGNDVPQGDTGEIWVRGANVFTGYLDQEATARVLTADGWLRTGDIGTTDDDGNLYLVDRSKDLIIVNGFNVFPAEVEGVLAEHPEIAEAGVVGVAHPSTGEAVKAFVVRATGSTIDEEAVIGWSEDHLARYKCPSKVLFVDELPRNLSGKIIRRQLV